MNEYRRNRVKVILITMTQDCELAKSVDIAVVLPHLSNVSYVHPLDDAITFYMFIEMVVERLNGKLNELAIRLNPFSAYEYHNPSCGASAGRRK